MYPEDRDTAGCAANRGWGAEARCAGQREVCAGLLASCHCASSNGLHCYACGRCWAEHDAAAMRRGTSSMPSRPHVPPPPDTGRAGGGANSCGAARCESAEQRGEWAPFRCSASCCCCWVPCRLGQLRRAADYCRLAMASAASASMSSALSLVNGRGMSCSGPMRAQGVRLGLRLSSRP